MHWKWKTAEHWKGFSLNLWSSCLPACQLKSTHRCRRVLEKPALSSIWSNVKYLEFTALSGGSCGRGPTCPRPRPKVMVSVKTLPKLWKSRSFYKLGFGFTPTFVSRPPSTPALFFPPIYNQIVGKLLYAYLMSQFPCVFNRSKSSEFRHVFVGLFSSYLFVSLAARPRSARATLPRATRLSFVHSQGRWQRCVSHEMDNSSVGQSWGNAESQSEHPSPFLHCLSRTCRLLELHSNSHFSYDQGVS